MPNMSYCRFQNTLSDLDDCYENMENELSDDENEAKNRLIRVCADIAQDYGYEIGLVVTVDDE
jgi:hypothetical protein